MQKILVYLLYRIESNVWKIAAIAGALVVFLLLSSSTTWYKNAYYLVADNDEGRDAATVSGDPLGDGNLSKVVYLDQGWDNRDSRWFYNITQGSDLLPYDFFLELQQADSNALFRSPENMDKHRYLTQKASKSNPDALPVGMVADTYLGKRYMGFTCAACHTSQVNYNGVGIRIDGGPAAADMDTFMNDLEKSLAVARDNPVKHQDFVKGVLERGNYGSSKDVEDDLKTYAQRIATYNFLNQSHKKNQEGKDVPVAYGYARLDAFGRIYNRVLEHLMNPDALKNVLTGALPPDKVDPLLVKLQPVLSEQQRDAVIDQLKALLQPEEFGALRDQIFNSPNAPCSYPFLWDIPYHDYVQWNGIGGNGEVGPLGRNAGEVIGVFGTLDWKATDRWLPESLTSLLGIGPKDINFQSSIKSHNLGQIEDRLWKLESPSWQELALNKILPAIDQESKQRGEKLYVTKCLGCHALIDPKDPERRIVADMEYIDKVGTDPTMANNSVHYVGFSGILRNQYLKVGVGSVLLDTKAPVAALLTKATEDVVATPDPDKWFFTRFADWLVDLIRDFKDNKIKPSVKAGTYTPDTTASAFAALLAYKGRPLNGIWATAPYLHNGSVPTLYDLLLPACPQSDDPNPPGCRPNKFYVGSRELDTKKVGFKSAGYPGFLFETSVPGNSNAGHDYDNAKFSEQDRMDLVEFMKSL